MRVSERPGTDAPIPGDLVAAARLRQKLGAKLEVPTPNWVRLLAAPANEVQLEEALASHRAQLRMAIARRKRRRWIDLAIPMLVVIIALLGLLFLPESSSSDKLIWPDIVAGVATAVALTVAMLAVSFSNTRSSEREMRDIERQYKEILISVEVVKQAAAEVSRRESGDPRYR
jgi:hypothetical protein